MSFSKRSGPTGAITRYGAPACVLLLALLGPSGAVMAGGMGDASAAMRANMAAYPDYFAPKPDAAPYPESTSVRRCKTPRGLAATDRRCRRR